MSSKLQGSMISVCQEGHLEREMLCCCGKKCGLKTNALWLTYTKSACLGLQKCEKKLKIDYVFIVVFAFLFKLCLGLD